MLLVGLVESMCSNVTAAMEKMDGTQEKLV